MVDSIGPKAPAGLADLGLCELGIYQVSFNEIRIKL
jgi:hypothetical protein